MSDTTNTHRVKKLFVANPMRMEITRFKSRFMRGSSSVALNRTMVGLVILCYSCILALAFSARDSLHVGGVLIAQSILTYLVVTAASHGAIAGERDRRSWDLLQVAPITQEQIVVGKFMGSLALIGALALAFAPFMLIGLVFYRSSSVPNLYEAFLGAMIALTSSSAVAAFTLYLSARLRNANTTLATAIGSLVGVLLVVPLVVTVLMPNGYLYPYSLNDLLFSWHPLYVLFRVLFPLGSYINDKGLPFLCGWPAVVLYLGATWLFLRMAIRHLQRTASQ